MKETRWGAIIMICVGILMMMGTQPLARAFAGASPGTMGMIYLVSPVGLIVLVLGIYRLYRKKPAP